VAPRTTGPKPGAAAKPAPPRPSGAKTLLLIMLVLLVALGLGALAYFSFFRERGGEQPPPKTGPAMTSGALHLESDPSEAAIFINGKPSGRTPADLGDLPLGEELTIRLEKDGYEVFVAPLHLSAARPKDTVKATLRKQ
jgi:hypothetical protein